MLLHYFMFQSAHAFDFEAYNQRSRSKRLEIGVCAGVSAECMLPGFKVGAVYNNIGIGFSFAQGYGYFATGSLRFYPSIDFPIRPYAYVGVASFVTFGGGGLLRPLPILL